MMSISALGSGSAAADYCMSSTREDYYTEGGDPPGFWAGQGSMDLGISGKIDVTDFQNLLLGLHPKTQQALTGSSPSEHRAGWDCTFSAPKAVSVLWAFSESPARNAIRAAHEAAVQAAMRYLEENAAFTRRGHGGAEQEKLNGLVAATFQHFTSRAGDPQLHTHCIVMNVAQREDGTVGTIESKHLFDHKMAAGAIYRMALGTELVQIGYDIERTRHGFDISGISTALCNQFSKRRQAIIATLSEHGATGPVASQIAALATREAKVETNLAQMFGRWRNEAKLINQPLPSHIRSRTGAARPVSIELLDVTMLLKEITHGRSAFAERDLVRTIAEQYVGQIEYKSVSALIQRLTADGSVVRLSNTKSGEARFTTREMLALEVDTLEKSVMLSTSKALPISETTALYATKRVANQDGFSLSDEQHKAMLHITCGTGQIALVEGLAGTGKTQMLKSTREVYQSAGLTVHGCSLSGKAAQNLEEGSGITSQTLHRLLAKLDSGEFAVSARDVVVLDEAAMVGSRQMHALLTHIASGGAKIVMIGDSKQLQPIDAGQMFGTLTRTLGNANLTEIRRQNEAWARQAVADAAMGQSGHVLDAFEQRGLITRSVDDAATVAALTQQWISDTLPQQKKLVVAGTRLEAYRLNQSIRQCLVESGQVDTMGVNFTTALGSDRVFGSGDRVVFLRNDLGLGVRNGTLGTVTETGTDSGNQTIRVRLDSGKHVEVPFREYAHLDHGYALTVHKSQGTTIDGNVYVMASETMTDREWSYVAISRAKGTTRIFTAMQDTTQLERVMQRSHRKETTLDYLAEVDLNL